MGSSPTFVGSRDGDDSLPAAPDPGVVRQVNSEGGASASRQPDALKVRRLRSRGAMVRWPHTSRRGEGDQQRPAGRRGGADVLFACGEDGTVKEVVNGMAGSATAPSLCSPRDQRPGPWRVGLHLIWRACRPALPWEGRGAA